MTAMRDLPLGTKLAKRYLIHDVIGLGTLATVYRATDTHLFDRPVAVKLLNRECDNQKYMREAEALSRIRHPSVVTLYDWGLTETNQMFDVTELVSGRPLVYVLSEAFEFARAAKLVRQLGQGLSAVHDQGIIHQDLHLHQILIRNEGTEDEIAMICDFGASRLKNNPYTPVPNIHGATPFWPPEQFLGITSEQSDVYSLGAIMYVILTGRQPEGDFRGVWSWIPTPRVYRPDLSLAAERALLKALARDPGARFVSAEAFGQELADSLALGRFAVGSPPRPLSVFLSHASGDKATVRDLYWKLKGEGINAWFDEVKLIPGHDWRLEIEQAVRQTDAVIICLSANSVSKEGYFQKELRMALDVADEKPEGAVFLMPVRLDNCIVPHRLSRLQWLDYHGARGLTPLLDALSLRARTVGS